MAFRYTVEYGLGRTGRVRRTHGGPRALLVIALDLGLGLAFGSIGLAWRLARRLVVTAVKLVLAISGLPVRALRYVSSRRSTRFPVKPTWAALAEL